jgi:pimeloyl-ACP methyl ester carboxylesterase
VVVESVRLDLAGAFSLSPDSTRLSYRTGGAAERIRDVYVASLTGGSPRNVSLFADTEISNQHQGYSSIPLWGPSGDDLYVISRGSLWNVSARQGRAVQVTKIEDVELTQLLSADGQAFWMDRSGTSTVALARDLRRKCDLFWKIDLSNGTTTKLFEREECYSCTPAREGGLVSVAPDSKLIVYVAENGTQPPDFWASDVDLGSPTRLSRLNPRLENRLFGAPRLIDWLDEDGETQRGALVLPTNYVEGQRYPLIVLVYGGRRLSDSFTEFGGFDREMAYFNVQLFATRGYAVLMPDALDHGRSPMAGAAKAILPGVNKAVALGIADPDKLGLLGHSYGGYTALSLVVQTRRFKAAVEASGMADLVGFYGEMARDGNAYGSAAETNQPRMEGTPWSVRDRYIENSPIFYLDRIETPLLMLHGQDDAAVASFLGDELYVGLRRLRKVAEYVKYDGEGHWIRSHDNQVDAFRRIIRWFNQYVRGPETKLGT